MALQGPIRRGQLQKPVEQEFDEFAEAVNTMFGVEHNPDDGKHTNINCDSVTTSETIWNNSPSVLAGDIPANSGYRFPSGDAIVSLPSPPYQPGELWVVRNLLIIGPGNVTMLGSLTVSGNQDISGNLDVQGVLNVAGVAQGVWQDYTPVLTAATSNPTNFTITGRYARVGDTFLVKAKVICGASWTGGTGIYSISLPDTMTAPGTSVEVCGSAVMRDAGTAWYSGTVRQASATTVSVQPAGSTAEMGPTVPFTFAAGDQFGITATVEAA